MDLKHTKETVISVEYRDLEHYIAQCYGLSKFEILESPNDTHHKFSIVKERLSDYDYREVGDMVTSKSGEHWRLWSLLTDLCFNDKLEEGTYIVNVSW